MADSLPPDPGAPPEDADDWSDEEWIAWLRATDEPEADPESASREPKRGDDGPQSDDPQSHEPGAGDPGADDEAAAPAPLARAARTRGGQLLGQSMLGLSQALFGEQDKPAVVAEVGPGDVEDEPVTVHLDTEHPERSWALLRARRRNPT